MPARLSTIRYILALTLRSRLAVLLVLFGVLLAGASLTVTYLTPGTERRTFFNLAYLGIELMAIAAPLLGSTVLQILEFDQRTIWLVLARPVSRRGYALARFAGLTVASWVLVLVALAAVTSLAAAMRALPEPRLAGVAAAALLEVPVMAALVCLATFGTTSWVTALGVGAGGTAVGYLSAMLPLIAEKMEGSLRLLVECVYWVLPHLAGFSVREFRSVPEGWYLAELAAYAATYAAALVLAGIVAFERREL